MYYLQSRYYDSKVGRFISADNTDLLKNIGSNTDKLTDINLFIYCGNNPINSEDQDGHWWFLVEAVTGLVSVSALPEEVVVLGLAILGYGIYLASSAALKGIIKFANQNKPIGRENRKKQGREVNEKKRSSGNFKSRSNKDSNREVKSHHTSNKCHRKY